MDLVYMPEALSYGSLRHPQYRDYEQPWNQDYFNYGKSTTRGRSQQPRNQQFQKSQSCSVLSSSSAGSSSSSSSSSSSKTVCLICKENKRRTLAAYIRGKARNNSCSEIHEEIEEEDEEEDEDEEEVEEFNRSKVSVEVQTKGEKKTASSISTSVSK